MSEDQSLKVFSYSFNQSTKLLFENKKHSLACTSVSWKEMIINNIQFEVIGTGGDDKNIHLYTILDDQSSSTSSSLIRYIGCLSTKDLIPRWHTITYFSIEENGDRVCCVTQNGYLIIWKLLNIDLYDNVFDIRTQSICLFKGKVSNGGIEGLIWRNQYIAVIGSDLTISIIEVDQLS